jgi:predicted PurR-regulated permease PerM
MDQMNSTQRNLAWGVIVVLVIVLVVLVGMSMNSNFSRKILGLFESFEDTGDFKDRYQQALVASVPTDEQLKTVSNQKERAEELHHTPKLLTASEGMLEVKEQKRRFLLPTACSSLLRFFLNRTYRHGTVLTHMLLQHKIS